MNKIFGLLYLSFTMILSSCKNDPYNKIGWFIYGFPVFGLCWILYQFLYGSARDKNNKK